ncbi:MAG TPA: alpha/beta hydrolase [Nevskia sp.]|nr:alpha/beta hydrolase [Nevskia sp.]
MSGEGFQFKLAGGRSLHVHRWLPPGPPGSVLLVLHGMAEHGARYARLGAALNQAGIAVYAPDLPGHGLSAAPDSRGHVAGRDGWAQILDAVHQLRRHLVQEHKRPLFLLGHSMGSFLAQHYIVGHSVDHGRCLAGAILSATTGSLGAARLPGLLMLSLQARLYGPAHRSALAEALTFKAFNKAFDKKKAPARTAFDWLSRDPAEVDKYVADPLCGFRCSAALWVDLLSACGSLRSRARLSHIPKALPVLLIAGSADPVSQGVRGPELLAAAYRGAGLKDVDVRIYESGRHELLNEIPECRDRVTAELLEWVRKRTGS